MDSPENDDRGKGADVGDTCSRLHRRVQELEALNRLATVIGSCPDEEKILQEVVDAAVAITRSMQGSIFIVDELGQEGMTTLVRGEGTEPDGIHSQVGRNLTGLVLHQKTPLIVDDLSDDDRFPAFRGKSCGIETALSVPLFLHGEMLGAINLCNKREGLFDDDDAKLVMILGSQSVQIIDRARHFQKLRAENMSLRKELIDRHRFDTLIGQSPSMKSVFALLERIVTSEASIIIQGESGTGKELVAKAIHLNGPRRGQNFVPVDCGAIPESLLESELFGYVRGAFTGALRDKAGLFQEASRGTLFLDEISNMSQSLQGKLLRVLQEREIRPVGATTTRKVDVRVISASSRDLQEMVAQGSFRQDLLYRLNVVTVSLPPLRQRREDIPLLAHTFVQRCAGKAGKPMTGFTAEAMGLLEKYDWPGNVRELENVIERSVTLASSDERELGVHLLPDALRSRYGRSDRGSGTLRDRMQEFRKGEIVAALRRNNGNKTRTAMELGLSRQGLINMLREIETS